MQHCEVRGRFFVTHYLDFAFGLGSLGIAGHAVFVSEIDASGIHTASNWERSMFNSITNPFFFALFLENPSGMFYSQNKMLGLSMHIVFLIRRNGNFIH